MLNDNFTLLEYLFQSRAKCVCDVDKLCLSAKNCQECPKCALTCHRSHVCSVPNVCVFNVDTPLSTKKRTKTKSQEARMSQMCTDLSPLPCAPPLPLPPSWSVIGSARDQHLLLHCTAQIHTSASPTLPQTRTILVFDKLYRLRLQNTSQSHVLVLFDEWVMTINRNALSPHRETVHSKQVANICCCLTACCIAAYHCSCLCVLPSSN